MRVMRMLKHKGSAIVLQEVPDEVSLAINISGCTHKCPGCHSQYLWDDDGDSAIVEMGKMIDRYLPYLSCICFMGGDQDQNELIVMCKIAHAEHLKTCLYTGYNSMSDLIKPLLEELDYVKIGSFIQEKGPLTSPSTNQRMYKKNVNGGWTDITDRFWTKYAEKKEASSSSQN